MIAVLLAAKEAGEIGISLIVCPASLVYNWVEEMARFAPALRAAALGGGKSERTMMLENYRAYDVLVTSYDLLKRDILLYEGKNFLYQVLDEAQFVKTHSTAAAKSVRLVQALHRFALTGTPIENRLSELWNLYDFLMPGYLFTHNRFVEKLEKPIVKSGDQDAREQLRRLVRRDPDVLGMAPQIAGDAVDAQDLLPAGFDLLQCSHVFSFLRPSGRLFFCIAYCVGAPDHLIELLQRLTVWDDLIVADLAVRSDP
jgi:hypothetical protein